MIVSIPLAYSSEDTIITVTLVGDSVISLDSKNQIIRAIVEIENYDPGDGHYFMKVVNTSTGEELKESEIFLRYFKSDIWNVQIAYIPQQNDLEVGQYEIQIITEFGNKIGIASFSVVDNVSPPTSTPVKQITNPITTITSSSSGIKNLVSIPQGAKLHGCEDSNNCFVPAQINIGVGEKVTWSNDDSAAHTVTSGDPGALDGVFDSSLFMAGSSFSNVFHEAGQFPYFCMVHPWMTGVVKVGGEQSGVTSNELSRTGIGTIDSFQEKGDQYYDAENYKTAITYYNRVLEIDPNNLETLNKIGLSYFFSGQDSKALEHFDKAISIDPTFYKPYYNKALVYEKLGQFDKSLVYFDKAFEVDPTFINALTGKGIFLSMHGRHTEAINEFERVLSEDPDNVLALHGKALAHNERGQKNDYFDALFLYNKVLEIDKEHSEALHNKKIVLNLIGQDFGDKHDFNKAISYFDKILEIDPNSLDALHNKANMLYQLGDYENALIYYDKALAIKPDYPLSLAGRGTVLNELGQYNDAISLFDKALALNPNDPTATQNIQFSYSKLNEIQDQIKQYQYTQNPILIVIGILVAISVIVIVGISIKRSKRKKIYAQTITKNKTANFKDQEWEGI